MFDAVERVRREPLSHPAAVHAQSPSHFGHRE
jgi:hypothetical protein